MSAGLELAVCPTHQRRITQPMTREEAIERLKSQRAELRAALARRPRGLVGREERNWTEHAKQAHRVLDGYAEDLIRGPRCPCEWHQLETLSWLASKVIGRIREHADSRPAATGKEPA